MLIAEQSTTLLSHLQKATHVALVPHHNPDADSLGSALAFAQFLSHHHIPHSVVCVGPLAQYLRSFPFFHTITTTISPSTSHIITFDASDARHAQLPLLIAQLPHTPHITVIDHHATNEHFGDFNIVIPSYPSTTSLIVDIFGNTNTPLTEKAATLLLTGLQTDTGNFTNPATTPLAFTTAAQLVAHGAVPAIAWSKIKRNKSPHLIPLFGLGLERLSLHPTFPLYVTYFTQADIERLACTPDDIGVFPDYLLSIAAIDSMMILCERPDGSIKGSLRTTRDDFDVGAIAVGFGGGGHQKAAGFIGTKKLHDYLV